MQHHRAEVRVESAGGILRKDADLFQSVVRRRAAAKRRHQSEKAARVRRADHVAQRVVRLAARERRQRLLHHADAFAHREQRLDVVLAEDEDFRHRDERSPC